MAKEYWVRRDGKATGPFSGHQLKQMAAAGMIVEADHISEDQVNWQAAGRVRGLFGETQATSRRGDDSTTQAQESVTAEGNDMRPAPMGSVTHQKAPGATSAKAASPEARILAFGIASLCTGIAAACLSWVAPVGILLAITGLGLGGFVLYQAHVSGEGKPRLSIAGVSVSGVAFLLTLGLAIGSSSSPNRYELKPTSESATSVSKELSLDLDSKGANLDLVLIPAGKFVMGSPDTEKGRMSDEGPQREVTISKPFYMGVTEVTQAQWRAVMGTEPWRGARFTASVADYAANWISWNDTVAFCKALSKKTGKTVRLPTEAEWEYACRAGSKTRFSFGDDDTKLGDYAWYLGNVRDEGEICELPVGRKKPNAWGLYDMHGNLYERCADCYADSYADAKLVDPQGPSLGSQRVFRGGSWINGPENSRSAERMKGVSDGSFAIGFRVVVEVGAAKPPAPQAATTASAGTPPKELLSFWGFEIGSSYSTCIGKMRALKQEGILSELSVNTFRSGATLVTGEGNVDRKGRLTHRPESIELWFRNDALEAIELSYSFKSNYPRDLFDRQVGDMERFLRTKAVVWITEDDVGNRTRHATVDRGRIRAGIESVLDGDFKSFAPDIRIYSRQIKPSDLTKQQKLHLAYARENE